MPTPATDIEIKAAKGKRSYQRHSSKVFSLQ